MPKNDYWDYLGNTGFYDDYLMHYGVLGMRWGHRKQAKFKNDIAYMNASRKYASNRHDYNSGKLTSNEFKRRHKGIAQEYRDTVRKNVLERKHLNKTRKPVKGEKISTIYADSKKAAEKMGGTAYKVGRVLRDGFGGLGPGGIGQAMMYPQDYDRKTGKKKYTFQ